MEGVTDPKLKQILEQLARFSFSFYSFDEDGTPLVKGPNNQIVPVNLAISFVNEQIARAKAQASNSSGSSLENPNLDTRMTQSSGVETSPEKSVEVQKQRPDQNVERQNNQIGGSQQPVVTAPRKAPQIVLKDDFIKPYGAGFDPKSFSPTNIRQTVNFIERSATKSAASSDKWLAEQFRKFLEEMKTQKK